jgi:hypothetical protein
VWDFDGTLSPLDSTTIAAEIIGEGSGNEFWNTIHRLKGEAPKDGDKEEEWHHVLAMDAPVWMYALSRLAFAKGIPLNAQTFENIVPHIPLFPKVASFLRKLKLLEETQPLKRADLKVHHFIVSAGLKDLVGQVLPEDLITYTFGCRYEINAFDGDRAKPESIPVFCMDETMKTRSLFEISKGSFEDKEKSVNSRILPENRWAPFENIVYVGDGYTDVPALSLVRSLGGAGIVVYDSTKSRDAVNKKLEQLRLDKRADLITPAVFETSSELFEYIRDRCRYIAHRYCAEKPI